MWNAKNTIVYYLSICCSSKNNYNHRLTTYHKNTSSTMQFDGQFRIKLPALAMLSFQLQK